MTNKNDAGPRRGRKDPDARLFTGVKAPPFDFDGFPDRALEHHGLSS